MARLEKLISPLVPSQFPAFFRENAPILVDFVQAYYQWMETEGPIYHNRRVFDYQDIDTTTDAFLVHFRKKYTTGIQLETAFNPRLLVKHALDLYRARGTPPAIDLFFRLVFGVGAEVFLPKTKLFRLSGGQWTQPIYLEVSTNQSLSPFVGLEIVGLESGSTAFCERVVRKLIGNYYDNVMFISAVEGTFIAGEVINSKFTPFPTPVCPTVVGSLSEIDILSGGSGFEIGDIVTINGTGTGALARVDSITSASGTINFFLVDGGYGYTANSEVLVANQVLSLSNVIINANNTTNWDFILFDTLVQPMANLNYTAATGGSFEPDNFLFTYFPNNAVKGTGYILSVEANGATNGQMFIAVLSGNLNANAIYMGANTVSANLPVSNGYINLTATGNVFSLSVNSTVFISNITGNFNPGETLTQGGAFGVIENIVAGAINLTNTYGVFYSNKLVTGQTSHATATVNALGISAGLINVTGTFVVDTRIPCSSQSISNGVIVENMTGNGGTYAIANLTFTETINVNNDFINSYLAVDLNTTYGFPADPTANLTTVLATAFQSHSVNIGRIGAITGIAPGTDYNLSPYTRVFEPLTFPYRPIDYIITITGNTAAFQDQELVTQGATSARGLFVANSSSGKTMFLERLNLFANFVSTTNSTTVITGQSSGATTNVTSVNPDTLSVAEDINQQDVGFNANIVAELTASNGAASALTVVDSGFAYTDNEIVTFSYPGAVSGQAELILGTQGIGNGFYLDPGSTLSGNSIRLQDSVYWQDFSYEVRTNLGIQNYENMLKNILHVAGTKYFGALYSVSQVNAVPFVQNATITIS